MWESRDDLGKLHIGYGVYVDPSILSIYVTQGLEECIIVSPETIFLSYQEWALFSLTPTVRNYGSAVGKSCFWPISQMTTRLEHIGDEIINNLILKRVVCPSAV